MTKPLVFGYQVNLICEINLLLHLSLETEHSGRLAVSVPEGASCRWRPAT